MTLVNPLPPLYWTPANEHTGEQVWATRHGSLRFTITERTWDNGDLLYNLTIRDTSRGSLGVETHFEDMWNARQAAQVAVWVKGERE